MELDLIRELEVMESETQIDLNYCLKTDPQDSFDMKEYYSQRLEVLKAIKEKLSATEDLKDQNVKL